ncbi:MAG TPA: hypothetical protein VIO61_01160 [Anaerolineaceae bacterium]
MLTESAIRELLDFSAPDPVLSIYLNTEPSQGNADAYRLRLRNMLKEVNLPLDIAAIERYFSTEYNWSGRGVAVFSCAPAGFFRAYPLAVPVRNLVHVGSKPSVKILAGLLDSYGGYGVVLIDKQGARLFSFHLGELREQEGMLGEAVKHTKRGGASTFPGRRGGVAGTTRYAEEVVDRNMKEAVDFAIHFFEENRIRRILIGGTDENVNQFNGFLPKSWLSLVIGTFPMSMSASHTEVLNRALQIGNEIEIQREARLVEDLLTAAAKNTGGVTGLEETLAAVSSGRVQTLVLVEGLRKRGYHCKETGVITTDKERAQSGSEGSFIPVADVVDLAVSAVMRLNGGVEIVQSTPAFEKAGGIGALLRY